ncbi:MAG: TetR/AcrR family transcriptional regulator [Proteobacteria bacterium]|nr:TetR/AcrR family transcriptional regulator [Pseudomonadota bacterium]
MRIHAPDVGMDQIARAAGVAVGTLCRHFPTKSDFVGAVESEVVDAVADDAEALLARVLAGETLGREITEFRNWVLPVRTPRKRPGSRSESTAPSIQVGRHVIESASF